MEPTLNDIIARNQKSFLSLVKRGSWLLLAFCCVLRLIFWMDIVNIFAMGIVILGWLIVTNVFLSPKVLNSFPLSSFLMLGFAGMQLYLPLIFTTLEGKSLIYNLELPEAVFIHTLCAVVTLTLAHGFYRLLSKITYSRKFSLMDKLGFFDAPSEFQMWGMGLIGLAASLYVYFIAADVGKEVTGAASDKLVQGLVPFCYAPFFIPFAQLYGGKEVDMRRLGPALIVFTVLLFAISVGRNSHGGAFMFGFTSVGFAYALGMLLGLFEAKIFTAKNFIIAGIGFWLLTGPIADLGTAMVITRGDRDNVSATELLMLTIDMYSDKEAIETRRREDTSETVDVDWDERYLDNIFTARFANLKFNDMSLIQYSKMRAYDPDMIEHSVDYVLAGLPDPFLKFLGIDVDKEWIYSMSMGDFLYLVAGGFGSGFISGFRVGHFAGTGMATAGWWYLAILALLMIPLFLLFDKFFKKKNVTNNPNEMRIKFSCCGMLSLTTIFQFLPAESVVNIATFLLRGWLQMAFLYFLIFYATLFGERIFKLKNQFRFQG